MRTRHSGTSLAALLVAAAPLMAQGVSTQLGGRVMDSQGAPVAGAKVVILNGETGLTRTLQTTAEGRYLATLLPVGPYTVTVTKAGFQTAGNIRVNLNLGDAAPLTIRLAPETGAVVEVVASAGQVDADRATSATNMSPESLSNLPVKGRGFTDFAFLTPQVTLSDRGNIAIGGQRGVNTSINVDGGDYNESFFGGTTGGAEGKTPFTVSIEAIREFQVITDGASAEFGRMGGGYLNAITKNGTNEFSGSLFYYIRPRAFVEKNPKVTATFDNSVPEFKTEQFGFSVGGPIIKDKLFYFVAFDGQKETRPVNFQWGGTTPTVLDPTLPGQANDAALIARNGAYSTKADSSTLFGRLDWLISTDHALQFRINKSDFKGDTNVGTLNAYENTSTDDVKTLSLVGQWNWTLGSQWVNEFRVSYVKDELPRNPRTNGATVSITNIGTYGKYPFTREFETKRKQITETLSFVTPTLVLKGGFDLNDTTAIEVFAPNVEGSYSFSSLANYRAGNWTSYTQAFGLNGLTGRQAGTFSADEKEQAAFIQADWRPLNSLKVGLGVRWDRQEHADFSIINFGNPLANPMPVNAKIPTDSQVSPRLSFSWTPEADKGRTVVRGSVGTYVSRTPAVFLYQVYANNAQRSASITFQSGQAATYGIPIGAAFTAQTPFVLAALPSVPVALDLWSFSPDFKNPKTQRATLGAERALGGWVLGLSGAYAKTSNLERVTDVNVREIGVNAYGRPLFNNTGGLTPVYSGATASVRIRPNTTYGRMGMYVSDAEGRYQAWTVSAKYQKPDSNFQAQFFYTWSKERDNDSNERNFSAYSTQNPLRLNEDWGYSNNDRRHVVTGYFSYLHPESKIQIGANVRYLSGTPYTITSSTDLNFDSYNNDRPMGTERNQWRTSSQMFVDLKLSRDWTFSKTMKMTLSGEVFNLLNRDDTYQRLRFTGTDAAPVFSTSPSIVSTPRQVQLGVRFAF